MTERSMYPGGGETTTAAPTADFRRRFVGFVHGGMMARVILGAALVLTGLAWYFSHTTVAESAAERFDFRTKEIEVAIVDRMLAYENVLWSGVGLFDASEEVTRADWNEFVDTMNLAERWPGIQGVGWSIPVDPAELGAHQEAIRAEGFPDYRVNPPGPRDEYSAIVYLEPFDWRNQRAFGFDMWSNGERRAAMARARDTGEAATSAMITLVQETDEDVQRGFLTYVPVYEGRVTPATIEERRDQLRGWVYAPFRMNDLMEGVIGSVSRTVDYEIYDGWEVAADALLFDSNPESVAGHDAGGDGLRRQVTVLVQGHPWTMVFEPGAEFAEGSEALPTYVAIAGVIIDTLLFYVISSLGLLNKRANNLATKMTEELRTTNDELHERSVELERQALQLQRSNDDLRRFAHAASHELQEPLRTMGSYSSMMMSTYDDRLDDDGRRWLSYINASAKRLSDLIRELRQYSTFTEMTRASQPVDLGGVMAEVVDDLLAALDRTGGEIVVGPLPTVPGDREQLASLLHNLVSNALRFHRVDAAPRVEVSATEQGGHWRICVRDNGVGIEPEFQERIFEVFRRATPDLASTAGTGMGLARCRRIVESHGGEIGVSSTPGQGSEFWVTLPAVGRVGDQDGRSGGRRSDDVTRSTPTDGTAVGVGTTDHHRFGDTITRKEDR